MPHSEAVVVDSATELGAAASGRVVVCGSHGGLYPGILTVNSHARAAIFHDAGVGRNEAGIAALGFLDAHSVPAAAVSSESAQIGSGASMMEQGRLTHVNEHARALGCRKGITVQEAIERLGQAPVQPYRTVVGREARRLLFASPRPVWALDSASLVQGDDAGSIVVTGSHGELLGGRDRSALKVEAFAAVFNDAGVAARAGHRDRLVALADRQIVAVSVAAASARIGDARSTYSDGVISKVNTPARRAGADIGMPVQVFVDRLLESAAPVTA